MFPFSIPWLPRYSYSPIPCQVKTFPCLIESITLIGKKPFYIWNLVWVSVLLKPYWILLGFQLFGFHIKKIRFFLDNVNVIILDCSIHVKSGVNKHINRCIYCSKGGVLMHPRVKYFTQKCVTIYFPSVSRKC